MNMDYSAYSNYEWRDLQLVSLMPSTDKFFHYSSSSTCFDMLKYHTGDNNKYMELWATHVRFMNDADEMIKGCEYIRAFLGKRKINRYKLILEYFEKYSPPLRGSDIFAAFNPNHFAVCFCGNGDLLSQWTYYGENGGVAIEYDLKNCEVAGHSSNENSYVKRDVFKILYDERNKESAIRAVCKLDNINKDYECQIRALRLLTLASLMKNASFGIEKESRLLFAPVYIAAGNKEEVQNNINKTLRHINFRERKGMIVPYLKIKIRHRDAAMHPVKSITIGPGVYQESIFNSAILFAKSNFQSDSPICQPVNGNEDIYNVNGIKIKRSLIPFRG